MTSTSITIRVKKNTRDILVSLASAEDRSVNYYLNKLIEQHLRQVQAEAVQRNLSGQDS